MAEAEVLDLTATDDEGAEEQPSPPAHSAVKAEGQHEDASIRPQFNNNPDAPKVTIVNGQGFWRSWTRSFRSTILKLLDLIDNAVEGSPLRTRRALREEWKYFRTYMNNNAVLREEKALVVHSTSKIGEEIGENGVGLKQACAALCDCSYVLVKNGDAGVELGIVAKALQREEGPYLPAFQFSSNADDSLREQMISLFSELKHDDVARCIAQYGATASGGDHSLAAGVDALCNHFDNICKSGDEYVFQVVLCDIRHDQEEGLVGRALYAQQKITINSLVKDLQKEIPKTYLHIPESVDFTVGDQRLHFKYWQERLVEMTTFTVAVGATIPWKQNFEVSDEHPDAYNLRLFLGFDRERIADPDVEAETGEKKETKNASLCFYSRSSGRLVKLVPDARHMLGLSSGSSLYGSALTIIIDDIDGHLPLDPTKQNTAFGLEPKGAVHEENLYDWVGAVAKFYYHHHLKKFTQKKVLTSKVSQFVESPAPNNLKTLADSDFTTFELTFEQARNTIRVDDSMSKEIIGPDTHFRLVPGNRAANNPMAGGRKRKQPEKYSDPRKPKRSHKKQPGKSKEQSAAKRGAQPATSREESDTEPNEEANVKTEETTGNNSFNDADGCIDLCDSSDNENGEAGGDSPPDANAPEEEPPSAVNVAAANPSAATESSRVGELEQALAQLREESKAKITSLESENASLKDQLKKKEAVVTALKKRLTRQR